MRSDNSFTFELVSVFYGVNKFIIVLWEKWFVSLLEMLLKLSFKFYLLALRSVNCDVRYTQSHVN